MHIVKKLHMEDMRIKKLRKWLMRLDMRIHKVNHRVIWEAKKIIRIEHELKRGARALLIILKSMRRFSARLDWDFKRVDHAGRILSKVDAEFHAKGWSKEEESMVKEIIEYK